MKPRQGICLRSEQNLGNLLLCAPGLASLAAHRWQLALEVEPAPSSAAGMLVFRLWGSAQVALFASPSIVSVMRYEPACTVQTGSRFLIRLPSMRPVTIKPAHVCLMSCDMPGRGARAVSMMNELYAPRWAEC